MLLREAERRGLVVPSLARQASRREYRYAFSDLRIRTKDRDLIPFAPNQPQRLYLDTLLPDRERTGPYGLQGVREILLKARQEGFSTLVQALFFLDTLLTPNTQTVVIAHDADSTERIFQMVSRFYRHLPVDRKPVTQRANRREYYWPEQDSYFFVGTAGAGDYGRGGTINNVHGSEVAYWPDAEQIVRGLLQSVPVGGNVFLESTANGQANWYYDEYQRAKRGVSRYRPQFFGWHLMDEYRSPVPAGFLRTDEEAGLAARYHLDDAQLQWRREKRLELGRDFPQEFPINDDEAFVSSGGRILFEYVDDLVEAGGHLYQNDWIPPATDRHFLIIDPSFNTTAALFAAVDKEGTVWCYGEYYRGARARGEDGPKLMPHEHFAGINALVRAYQAVQPGIRYTVIMDPAGFNPVRAWTGKESPPWDDEFRRAAKACGATWYGGCRPADNGDTLALRVNRYLASGRWRVGESLDAWRFEAARWVRERERSGPRSDEAPFAEKPVRRFDHLAGACSRYLANELPEPLPSREERPEPLAQRVAGGGARPKPSRNDPYTSP